MLRPYKLFLENTWFKHPIISHADFYGAQPPPHIKWKATTQITSGGSGSRKVIRMGSLDWHAIGGADAGVRTLIAPRRVGRTRIAFRWSGVASNPRLTPGMKMRLNIIATCYAACTNAALLRWSHYITSPIRCG